MLNQECIINNTDNFLNFNNKKIRLKFVFTIRCSIK